MGGRAALSSDRVGLTLSLCFRSYGCIKKRFRGSSRAVLYIPRATGSATLSPSFRYGCIKKRVRGSSRAELYIVPPPTKADSEKKLKVYNPTDNPMAYCRYTANSTVDHKNLRYDRNLLGSGSRPASREAQHTSYGMGGHILGPFLSHWLRVTRPTR